MTVGLAPSMKQSPLAKEAFATVILKGCSSTGAELWLEAGVVGVEELPLVLVPPQAAKSAAPDMVSAASRSFL